MKTLKDGWTFLPSVTDSPPPFPTVDRCMNASQYDFQSWFLKMCILVKLKQFLKRQVLPFNVCDLACFFDF